MTDGNLIPANPPLINLINVEPEPEIIPQLQENTLPVNINRNNFPRATILNEMLFNMQFNNLLTKIKNQIIIANKLNNNYIKLYYINLDNCPQPVINNLKNFLSELGYQINLIEDNNNNNIGLKIIW
jgi:hypothetical protein